MPLLSPKPSSRVVGDLACQQDSYLRTIDSEVISCVEASPPKTTNGTKNSSKKGVSTPDPEKLYLIEFTDSVLFPEGISLVSRDTKRSWLTDYQVVANLQTTEL
jgi:misacylated tRNA(Ala) deacylase